MPPKQQNPRQTRARTPADTTPAHQSAYQSAGESDIEHIEISEQLDTQLSSSESIEQILRTPPTMVRRALDFDMPPKPTKGKTAVHNPPIDDPTAPGPSGKGLSGRDGGDEDELPSRTVNKFAADSDLTTLEAKI